MFFGSRWWPPGVAGDDGGVVAALEFEIDERFDASSDCSGSAFVGATADQVVNGGQKPEWESYGDLLGSHSTSIPYWYAKGFRRHALL